MACPQSPLRASDPLMWGVGTPQRKPHISFPAATMAEQEEGTRADQEGLISVRDGLQAGGGDSTAPAWQGHKCREPWLVPAGPSGLQVGVCAGVRQVKQGDFEPSSSNSNGLGVLLCEGVCASAGASASGAAVADSDSLPSSRIIVLALAGSKLPFLGAAAPG